MACHQPTRLQPAPGAPCHPPLCAGAAGQGGCQPGPGAGQGHPGPGAGRAGDLSHRLPQEVPLLRPPGAPALREQARSCRGRGMQARASGRMCLLPAGRDQRLAHAVHGGSQAHRALSRYCLPRRACFTHPTRKGASSATYTKSPQVTGSRKSPTPFSCLPSAGHLYLLPHPGSPCCGGGPPPAGPAGVGLWQPRQLRQLLTCARRAQGPGRQAPAQARVSAGAGAAAAS